MSDYYEVFVLEFVDILLLMEWIAATLWTLSKCDTTV
jgi:hypothetical protein